VVLYDPAQTVVLYDPAHTVVLYDPAQTVVLYDPAQTVVLYDPAQTQHTQFLENAIFCAAEIVRKLVRMEGAACTAFIFATAQKKAICYSSEIVKNVCRIHDITSQDSIPCSQCKRMSNPTQKPGDMPHKQTVNT
jgi:hypothetical protein